MRLRSSKLPWWRTAHRALVRNAVCATAASFAIVSLGALASVASELRAEALASAEHRLQQLAQTLAFPLAEAVSDADALLERLADAQTRSAAEALQATTRALEGDGGTWLRTVAVVDRSGRILASSDAADLGTRLSADAFGPWPVEARTQLGPRISARRLSDLRAGPEAVMGPPGQGSTVLLRRAWHVDHGEVLLVGLFTVEGLVNRLRTLVLQPDVAVAIVDYSGNLLAASEVTGAEPRTLAPFTRFLPRFESGQWQGDGLWPGARIGSFQGSGTLPLVLWVEGSKDAALAQWAPQARRLGAVAVLLLLATGAGLAGFRKAARGAAPVPAGADPEAPLPAALAKLPVGLFQADRHGTVTSMSPRAAAMLGIAGDPAGGDPLWSRLPADVAGDVQRWFRALAPRTGTVPAPWQGTLVLGDPEGAMRVHRIGLAPVVESGRVQAVIGSLAAEPGPSTAGLEAELRGMRSRVAMSEVLVREIRQPLQTILGWSELGHARGLAAGTPADVYARILGASCRIQALVDDLSADGGAAALAATLEFRAVDLRTVAAQVFAGLQPLVHARGQELRLAQDDTPLRAMVDTQALPHALATLVLHALDGAADEQVVTISTRRNGGEEAVITVSDDSGRRLGTHWGGLYAGRPSRPIGGADLDACRRVVAAHSGRIHAVASQAQGSVQIILPLAASDRVRA